MRNNKKIINYTLWCTINLKVLTFNNEINSTFFISHILAKQD